MPFSKALNEGDSLEDFEVELHQLEPITDKVTSFEVSPVPRFSKVSGVITKKSISSYHQTDNLKSSGLNANQQNLVAETISLLIEKSTNTKQLFQNLELALYKILGKYCTGIHIMICDEDFVHEIKLNDRGQNNFKFRKLTVGPDLIDYIKMT